MPQGWMVGDMAGNPPLALASMMGRRGPVTVPVVAAGRCPSQEAARPTMIPPHRGVGVRLLRGGLNADLTEQVEKVEVSGPEVQGADRR